MLECFPPARPRRKRWTVTARLLIRQRMSYNQLMALDTYTLKEVAAVLCASGDPAEVERIARQVRHWTVADLLHPTGKKHTGTGRSRRYTADEIRKASILLELSR